MWTNPAAWADRSGSASRLDSAHALAPADRMMNDIMNVHGIPDRRIGALAAT